MSATDSVSVFAEGTFEEQIRELVNYLAQGRSDEEKASFIQPFEDALVVVEGQKPFEEDEDRRRKVFLMVLEEVKGLGNGAEREIEGFFNLLFAHLLSLFPPESSNTREHLSAILKAITSHGEPTPIRYRLLSNLFNALPRRSGLRLLVNQALLKIANADDEVDRLQLSLDEVNKWLSEWDVTSEEKSAYLKTLVDIHAQRQPATSYQYELAYVRSLPSSSSQPAALNVIATALRLPSIFDYDPLFRLDAVIASKNSDLYSLLQIFLNDGLAEYKAWAGSHSTVFAKYSLDQSQLERKIRLLSLTTLAFQNVGRDLPYSTISDVLQVETSQVERWVIDVLRTGLVSGKLSQTNQTFHVIRATARAFERAQWQSLEKRLLAWKTGLAGVRDVVAAAKKKNTPEPAVSTANGVDASAVQIQTVAA